MFQSQKQNQVISQMAGYQKVLSHVLLTVLPQPLGVFRISQQLPQGKGCPLYPMR